MLNVLKKTGSCNYEIFKNTLESYLCKLYKTGCPGIKPGQSPQNAEKLFAHWLDLTFILERMY